MRISEAFKDVQLSDGVGLSEANAIDDYKDDGFLEECKKQDEKHNWQAIPSEALNKYNCSLSFFDAKGMKFHLPAFMIAEINNEYRFGMSFALTNLSDHSKSQFGLLSKDQKNTVKLFLEYLLEQPDYEFEKPDIIAAVENYWSV
ncbi:MAG: DUF6714 family protein [Bacteroidia bacterium]